MIATLTAAWAARSLREQRMLMGLGLVLALTLLWFGLVAPLIAWRGAAMERHEQARQDHALVVSVLGDAQTGDAATALEPAVRAAADANGLALASVATEADGRLTVTIDRADAAALFAWLAAVEAQGARIQTFSALENADATLLVQVGLAGASS